jgi:alpha-tubulin suppressor-like RCC1 family protein
MVRTAAALAVLAAALLAGCGGAPEFRAVAAGELHSMAIDDSGRLWSWGANGSGQLGDGTTRDRSRPARVEGLSGVVAAAGGARHGIALRANGTVWSWGGNDGGQLGDDSPADRGAPARVEGLEDVTAVSAGWAHSAALRRDGSVWTWGMNSGGELGDGTTQDRRRPGRIEGLPPVRAISCGAHHTLAMAKDGSVWAWGPNGDGRLGDGTTQDRLKPVRTELPEGVLVAAVAAGGYHSLALTDKGEVLAWGSNWSEAWQLANTTTMNRTRPTPVSANRKLEALGWPVIPLKEPFRALDGVKAIVAGGAHSLAMAADGALLAWGQNARWGQLGVGRADWFPNVETVRDVREPRAMAAGKYHSLAVTADGKLLAWGGNNRGQLGLGTADMLPHGIASVAPIGR